MNYFRIARRLAAPLLTLLLLPVILLTFTRETQATSFTFVPTADAYVSAGQPNTNFGSSSVLAVRAGGFLGLPLRSYPYCCWWVHPV